jgi:hypothetical protein
MLRQYQQLVRQQQVVVAGWDQQHQQQQQRWLPVVKQISVQGRLDTQQQQ